MFSKNPCFKTETRVFYNIKYNLVLGVHQAAMATRDVLSRYYVVIELDLVDEERIVKYLYEHDYSYNWILREDKEAEKVRLYIWWREGDCSRFCATPLRSFLKRLKNKVGYEKIIISPKRRSVTVYFKRTR